jgi:DNA-binding GntR family transcriptional regulator
MARPRTVLEATVSRLPDDSDTPPTEHLNLDEKVYTHLRGLIVSQALRPGARLALDALARSLGVSRTPLINALKRLTQEQYVTWLPRHGIYVRQFRPRELAELFQIRAVLEGLSARLAAQRITDGELGELEAMLPATAPRETPATLRRYLDLDRRFHWRLVELSGSEQLVRTVETVSLLIFTYQKGMARFVADSLREHREILGTLRRRDGEGCENLMRRHHELAGERFRRESETEEQAAGSADRTESCRRGRGSGGEAPRRRSVAQSAR